MMKKIFILHFISFIFLAACSGQTSTLPPSTSTAQPIASTSTLTPTQKPTPIPSSTPIPIEFVTLGSPFDKACGIPLLIVDNSFNGVQGKFDSNHGHFDIWTSDCDSNAFDGEVITPVSGKITKNSGSITRNAENVYALCLPQNTYFAGIIEAAQFAGINNPKLEQIQELCIDLGHLELLPEIQLEQKVEKGQHIGNLVKSQYPSPKLAYQIVFVYQGKFYMTSPTLYKHDVYYPMNFKVPDDPIYKVIYPNGESPWLFDPRIKNIMGSSWAEYYNYPEPMAYP
jgi:hypothetical protein